MAAELFANNFAVQLAVGCLAADTAIQVTAPAPTGLQSGQFRVLIDSEYMLVTGGQSTTTWTVTRGAATGESPAPVPTSHAVGSWVTHSLTAAALANLAGGIGVTVPASPTTSGQVLTSTSNSAASWQTPAAGLTLDTNATDIQMNGTQAAGAIGKAADAGHVHPSDTSRVSLAAAPVNSIAAAGDMLVGSGAAQMTVLPAATSPGLVLTSGDPSTSALPSWAAATAASAAPQLLAGGSLSGNQPLPLNNQYVSWIPITLTGDINLTVSSAPAGSVARITFTQDSTGGHNVTITNTNGQSVSPPIEPAALFQSVVWVYTRDGLTLEVIPPSLLGRTYTITASGAWSIPTPATKIKFTCVGGGGGGGAGASGSATSAYTGGSGGGAGWASSQVCDVHALATVTVAIGAGGAGGTAGAAGGNAGGDGSYGGDTTVTATGISVKGARGFKGVGAGASSTSVTPAIINNGGSTGIQGGANLGGFAGGTGSNPNGFSPGSGGGGGPATSTLGGGGGGAGAVDTPGVGGSSGASASANGVAGTAATAPGAGGGGGGGAATATGVAGAGGAGAAGFVVAEVVAAGTVALPVPSSGSMLWNALISSGSSTQVVYTSNNATLSGAGQIEVGLTNPTNDSLPATYAGDNRVWAMAPSLFGGWSGKANKVLRFRNWDTDTNNKNVGQQAKPACSMDSPSILGNYAAGTSNWHVFFGMSLMFPDGTQRDDHAFPLVASGNGNFFQVFEDFGPPYTTSPVWQIAVRDGAYINANGAGTLTSGVNYLHMPSIMGPAYPAMWVGPQVVNGDSHTYDIIIEVGRSTAASTDGGVTGGFLNLWVNGVRQTFTAGATEGGSSSANWTRANTNQTLIVPTLVSGDSGTGFGVWGSYRTPLGVTYPITIYQYVVGIATNKNSADPALN